jgi:AcrR family transcriptional regulator
MRRTVAKAANRRRILTAAGDLIRDVGAAGFSMRALATRAEVSLATPYNLLGSKRGVLLAMLDEALASCATCTSETPPEDPLGPLFGAVDSAVEVHLADPAFHRILWQALAGEPAGGTRTVTAPRPGILPVGFLELLVRVGVLAEDINVPALAAALERSFRGAMMDWAMGWVDSEGLGATIRHAFGLILTGAASAHWREPLATRMRDDQGLIARDADAGMTWSAERASAKAR